MLYQSGSNLEDGVIQFIDENNSITLYSAYLKLEELRIINQSKTINRIIVRWEVQDLCLGVSDIELYDYCLKNKITLYRNTRIHLKAFWNNAEAVLFGSANVTGRGIGEKGKYNYELNGKLNNLDYEDISYFNEIILNSEYVDDSLYKELKYAVNQTQRPTIEYPKIETRQKKVDYFLLSHLPMTETVDGFYKAYCSPYCLSVDEINYVTHDIALYNIPKGLDKSEFYSYLKETFNSHPFIVSLKEYIKTSDRQSLNYGGVIRWIQNNTTTVPTPRSWEIKKNIIVNILYHWICSLDDNYQWGTPKFSQIISYTPKHKQLNN